MEGWYVAKFKVQKEDALFGYLSQSNVQVFSPKIISPGHNAGKPEALFPTYLFCFVDPESRTWQIVRWAPGISYFLSYDGEPAMVPEEMVQYLRNRVTQCNDPSYSSYLSSGDRVIVTEGPFAGLEAVFQRYTPSKERCRILLEAVGRQTSVELPAWELTELHSTIGDM